MIASDFNPAAQVSKTRETMGKRLGEIIEEVIGDSRVRELFVATGKHPDEYAGKPTGLAALDLKVITPETKSALLIAQAAERTYQLAEKTEKILAAGNHHAPGHKLDGKSAGAVSLDNKIFQFVGSPNDSPSLQKAQATWVLAQSYLNHEVLAYNDYGNLEGMCTQGPLAVDGFKKAASEQYAQSAALLRQEGHAEAAEKMEKVASTLDASVKNKIAPTPSQFASNFIESELEAVAQANVYALREQGVERWQVNKANEAIIQKMIKLVNQTPASRLPAATTGPKS